MQILSSVEVLLNDVGSITEVMLKFFSDWSGYFDSSVRYSFNSATYNGKIAFLLR